MMCNNSLYYTWKGCWNWASVIRALERSNRADPISGFVGPAWFCGHRLKPVDLASLEISACQWSGPSRTVQELFCWVLGLLCAARSTSCHSRAPRPIGLDQFENARDRRMAAIRYPLLVLIRAELDDSRSPRAMRLLYHVADG